MIKSGEKQGCRISQFLFLLCLDWVIMKATADKRRGITRNFTTVRQDLDFTDDIALLSSMLNYLHGKTGTLAEKTVRVGLKLNAKKYKTRQVTECASSRENIVVDGKEVMTLRSLHT